MRSPGARGPEETHRFVRRAEAVLVAAAVLVLLWAADGIGSELRDCRLEASHAEDPR